MLVEKTAKHIAVCVYRMSPLRWPPVIVHENHAPRSTYTIDIHTPHPEARQTSMITPSVWTTILIHRRCPLEERQGTYERGTVVARIKISSVVA